MHKTHIMVFDQINLLPPAEVLSAVADPAECELTLANSTIRGAMRTLIDIKHGYIRSPDMIIIANRLDNDEQYVAMPELVQLTQSDFATAKTSSPRRGILKQRANLTALLPVSSGETMSLPTIRANQRAYDLERARHNYNAALSAAKSRSSPAMFMVSHAAQLLLSERNIDVIGMSPVSPPIGLPITGFIDRTSDSTELLQHLINARSSAH